MPNTLANLARQSSTTTGTGTLTLGPVVQGFNTFADAGLTNGQTVTYAIEDYSADNPATVVGREIGVGTFSTAGPTIARTTVYSSTSAGAKINCSGRQHVFITAAAEDLASFATDLTAHLNDTSDAHDASAISFTPAGNVAATDVQAAIAELDSEKLSTSAAASAYQPLDSDLTTLAANITAFGHSLVDDADASAARTTLGLVIGTNVQAQDAELAAIAGLTSAADRLPYFTGSGTASLATFTTAGRNLVDDADASAQRTTLGLGTAATQATGTSGATLPFLNGVNTWSGAQTFDYQTHTFTWSDDGAATGPVFNFVRNSASPAIGDSIAGFNWVGKDSAGNNTGYGLIEGIIVDPTNTSEDGRLRFWVYQAGTQTVAMRLALGLVVGSPTGSEKGHGTINAVAVYDDSVLLCAPVEYMKSGTVNTATWDQYTADYHESEGVIEGEDTVEIDLPEPVQEVVGQKDGTLRLVTKTKTRVPVIEDVPVLDDKGRQVGIAKVPKRTRTPVPEKLVKRQNELAHEFKAMLDEGFDPRDPKAYFDKMLADEALPGLKTKANWVPNEESNAKRTNRIILALELQTAVVKTLYERLEALEAKVKR